MPDEKIALITGGGGGIGRATAIALRDRGYQLALFGRSLTPLQALQPAIARSVDVTDPVAVEGAVADVVRHFGRLDAVVNCAGLAPMHGVETTTPAVWRAVLDTNLSGAFYMSRAAWPTMVSQTSGVIVNVSSMAAKDPFPRFTAYAAAKAGLNAMTLSMAREGAPLGIAVHCIAPGAVQTPMLRKIMSTEQVPESTTLSPDDVAAMIVRCVTGELRHTSGETMYIQKML